MRTSLTSGTDPGRKPTPTIPPDSDLFFLHAYSTGENIAVFVWESVGEALGEKAKLLHEVAVEETENNTFTYRGEVTDT